MGYLHSAEAVFDEFMKACSTEVLEAGGIDNEELLSMYFNKKPPFGDGKKKAEFPDAIALLSLKLHLQDGEKIYVVSDDPDHKAYCDCNPQFISVESLGKLLDIYTTHTNERHDQVKQYFFINEATIKQKIKDYLEDCDVYNFSSWEDSDVDGGITVTRLAEIEPSVLYINDEESQITFDIDVEFEVTVTGPDFTNGIYDREDGRMYTFDSTSRTSRISTSFTVEMFLYYEFLGGELVNVTDDLHIAETSGGIEVSVDENEPDWF